MYNVYKLDIMLYCTQSAQHIVFTWCTTLCIYVVQYNVYTFYIHHNPHKLYTTYCTAARYRPDYMAWRTLSTPHLWTSEHSSRSSRCQHGLSFEWSHLYLSPRSWHQLPYEEIQNSVVDINPNDTRQRTTFYVQASAWYRVVYRWPR